MGAQERPGGIMKLGRLVKESGLVLMGRDLDMPIKISVDSRTAERGGGFVALRGSRTDGHRFIPDVLAKGVSCVICEKDAFKESWLESGCTFVLSDGRCEYAIASLASAYVGKSERLREVVAVTGSVGKTSTKNYAKALLEGRYSVHAAGGNYNTLIGCSVTALAAPADTEILLLEMGANHRGEIAEMVRYLPPTIACVTEIAPAHLEYFGTLEGVLDAKSEIFASPKLRTAVINGDNRLLCQRVDGLGLPKVVKFGHAGQVSFESERVRWKSGGFSVSAVMTGLDGVSFKASLPISGVHQLYPISCACAVAGIAGMSSREIADALHKCRSASGRGEVRISGSGAAIIDECYNASPVAVLASLASMATPDILGKKVLVLGEMLELGEATEFQHDLVFRRAKRVSDKIFLFGKSWESVNGASEYIRGTLEEIIADIDAEDLREGDVVLVKGSRSNHLERVVRALEI